jgi:hypothetical protein
MQSLEGDAMSQPLALVKGTLDLLILRALAWQASRSVSKITRAEVRCLEEDLLHIVAQRAIR